MTTDAFRFRTPVLFTCCGSFYCIRNWDFQSGNQAAAVKLNAMSHSGRAITACRKWADGLRQDPPPPPGEAFCGSAATWERRANIWFSLRRVNNEPHLQDDAFWRFLWNPSFDFGPNKMNRPPQEQGIKRNGWSSSCEELESKKNVIHIK